MSAAWRIVVGEAGFDFAALLARLHPAASRARVRRDGDLFEALQ